MFFFTEDCSSLGVVCNTVLSKCTNPELCKYSGMATLIHYEDRSRHCRISENAGYVKHALYCTHGKVHVHVTHVSCIILHEYTWMYACSKVIH